MSRNYVSKTLIDLLVTTTLIWGDSFGKPFYYYWRDGWNSPMHEGNFRVTPETVDRTGDMLWRTNWKHTMSGWDDGPYPQPLPYRFEAVPGDPNPLVVLRAIAEYESQTENEEYHRTEASAFCIRLQVETIDRLPGFDDLPWGLDDSDRDVFLRYPNA